jgi:hypothetical protein
MAIALAGADMPFNVCGPNVYRLGTTQTPTSTESAPATWIISGWPVIRSECPGQPVTQTAGFSVCGSSLTRATRYGVSPAGEETRTTEAVVRAPPIIFMNNPG